MKRISRVMSIMAAVLLTVTTTTVPASAAGYSNSVSVVNSSKNFTKEWEKTRTYKVNSTVIAYMVYGYDTDYINEDYVWTKSLECKHTPYILRKGIDSGYKSGSQKNEGTWSKYEITHKTNSTKVYYKIALKATYSNVKYTTADSAIKD